MNNSEKHIQNDLLHEIMEMPWRKSFILLLRRVSLRNIFENYKSSFSIFLQENYHHVENLTLLDPFRLDNNIKLLNQVSNIEGDIAECGCYKGGNAILMALWLKEHRIEKKIILFDSFEGLPLTSDEMDKGYNPGQFIASYDELILKIQELKLENYFEINRGWFKDTIPKFMASNINLKFSLLHIDCDLYESTMDCFPPLIKLLNIDGVAILDDFNDGARGEKIAVLASLEKKVTFQMGPAPQAFFINNKVTKIGFPDSSFNYNFDEIMKNWSYLQWLNDVLKFDYKNTIQENLR
jgi:hypothetical protein